MNLKYFSLCLALLLTFTPITTAAESDIDKALALIRGENPEQSLPILHPLAAEGNVEAMIALGYYYLLEKEDQPRGLSWFRKGALSGNAEAQLHIGLVLTEILKGNDNFSEGVDWLKKSGHQGNKMAAQQLASIYYTGRGGIRKNPTLYKWWSERAKTN